jgi:hydroxycarboxylate dehydrogenase B
MPLFSSRFLQALTTDVFAAQGAPRNEAAIVAEQLVLSNLTGLDSHGVVRIPLYSKWIREGVIKPGAAISLVSDQGGTAIVDCGYNFGQVGGLRAMEVALAKAREHKIGCVVTRRCCHVGRLGYFVEMASNAGFFALAMVNSSRAGHRVVPFGGLEGRVAPNPIAYAAPGSGRPILADMAMSTTSQGKVVVYRNRGERLPDAWLIDASGRPTTDPEVLWSDPVGWILPMGGSVGYKGFALLLLAEILGGALAGREISAIEQDGINGVCFVVIDVSAFGPVDQFKRAVDEMVRYVKSTTPAPGFREVLVPGEIDDRNKADRQQNGIPLDDTTWRQIRDVAASLNVAVTEPTL